MGLPRRLERNRPCTPEAILISVSVCVGAPRATGLREKGLKGERAAAAAGSRRIGIHYSELGSG